ncbi:MAG: DUF4251 domain-containing protein [Prevotellaceae bacterium]|nr:DUF4251 domain-containing protein [Prevotellaceae bacterium]
MNVLRIKLVSLVFMLISSAAMADDPNDKKKEKSDEIGNLIESKSYVFVARSVTPLSGATKHLSSGYDLTLAGDTLVAFLPYFGRAYMMVRPGADGGIKFTSTKYEYKLKTIKRGWEISLKTKDVENSPELFLSISKSGYAELRVSDISRESISFYGHIEARKD